MQEPLQTPWPGVPKTSSEFVTLIAHYYRAEMSRMSGWRDRIDRTTNWAITVAGAMLSVSLSTPTAHHGVLLFAMILVLFLLVMKSRRYRFFDVYRARVRLLEQQYFARIFSPVGEAGDASMRGLSDDLKRPVFLIEQGTRILPPAASQLRWDVPDSSECMAAQDQLSQAVGRWEPAPLCQFRFRMGQRRCHRAFARLDGADVSRAFYGWIIYSALRRYAGEGELRHRRARVRHGLANRSVSEDPRLAYKLA